jgi:transcriptional regulator with XRE-family HTH domain
MPSDSLGERLREARKRAGMSQRDLARISGVSLSLIRKLEQGERNDTRLETAHRLAAAVRIPTTRLLAAEADSTQPPPADGPQWSAVRAALAEPGRDDVEEPPTVAGVRRSLDTAVMRYASGDLDGMAAVLPPLIRDAEVVAGLDTGHGRTLRMQVMQITGRLMTQTRHYDAAETALDRASVDVPDLLHGAAATNTRCWLLLRRGRLEESRTLAIQWADEAEPRITRATPGELAAWGWLLLRVAASSARDNRPDEADQALSFAEAAAVAMGRRQVRPSAMSLRRFDQVTVQLQRAEHAMVRDKPGAVLRLAADIPLAALPKTSGNRNRHLLDVANAQSRIRKYAEAVETLERIHRDAPQWLPHQRYAKEILGGVVSRRRTLTPQMRVLAEAVRLPL